MLGQGPWVEDWSSWFPVICSNIGPLSKLVCVSVPINHLASFCSCSKLCVPWLLVAGGKQKHSSSSSSSSSGGSLNYSLIAGWSARLLQHSSSLPLCGASCSTSACTIRHVRHWVPDLCGALRSRAWLVHWMKHAFAASSWALLSCCTPREQLNKGSKCLNQPVIRLKWSSMQLYTGTAMDSCAHSRQGRDKSVHLGHEGMRMRLCLWSNIIRACVWRGRQGITLFAFPSGLVARGSRRRPWNCEWPGDACAYMHACAFLGVH